MEVVARRREPPEERAQILELPGQYVHYPALLLHFPAHREQSRGKQLAPLALGEVVPDDEVHVAGLVFQRHEDHAARGRRALAAGHDPRHLDPRAVTRL